MKQTGAVRCVECKAVYLPPPRPLPTTEPSEEIVEALYEHVRALGFHGPDAKPYKERSKEHRDKWREALRAALMAQPGGEKAEPVAPRRRNGFETEHGGFEEGECVLLVLSHSTFVGVLGEVLQDGEAGFKCPEMNGTFKWRFFRKLPSRSEWNEAVEACVSAARLTAIQLSNKDRSDLVKCETAMTAALRQLRRGE